MNASAAASALVAGVIGAVACGVWPSHEGTPPPASTPMERPPSVSNAQRPSPYSPLDQAQTSSEMVDPVKAERERRLESWRPLEIAIQDHVDCQRSLKLSAEHEPLLLEIEARAKSAGATESDLLAYERIMAGTLENEKRRCENARLRSALDLEQRTRSVGRRPTLPEIEWQPEAGRKQASAPSGEQRGVDTDLRYWGLRFSGGRSGAVDVEVWPLAPGPGYGLGVFSGTLKRETSGCYAGAAGIGVSVSSCPSSAGWENRIRVFSLP